MYAIKMEIYNLPYVGGGINVINLIKSTLFKVSESETRAPSDKK